MPADGNHGHQRSNGSSARKVDASNGLTQSQISAFKTAPLPDVEVEEEESRFERRIDQHFTVERAVYARKY